MDRSPIYLNTYIPELPKLLNNSFDAVQRQMALFYDASRGVLTKPLVTTGTVSGGQANFTTGVFDNLIVRTQFTNIYDNVTYIDSDYYNAFIGSDVSTRDASTTQMEDPAYRYAPLTTPYVKLTNDASYAFTTDQLGQEFQIIYDSSSVAGGPFSVLVDPSVGDGTQKVLTIDVLDSSLTWVKLIAVEYDASWGTTYTVKQWTGNYSITTY